MLPWQVQQIDVVVKKKQGIADLVLSCMVDDLMNLGSKILAKLEFAESKHQRHQTQSPRHNLLQVDIALERSVFVDLQIAKMKQPRLTYGQAITRRWTAC